MTATETTETATFNMMDDIISYRDDIIAAYGESDKSGKAKIRADLSAQLMDAVRNLDMAKAKTAQEILESIKSVSTKDPVDPTAVLADRIITLRTAASMLMDAHTVPAGLCGTDDAGQIDYVRLAELIEEFGQRATSDAEWASAEKLAETKITRANSGSRPSGADRRDIAEWIGRATDTMDEGQFATISQLVNLGVPTDVEDDNYRPSNGAITARLYPTKGDVTLDMWAMQIELATNTAGTRGVRKI